ncbi:hypothetical protein DA100_08960 [Vibrio sp. Hep-1b-8]|nr:hypothetical protein DA100_08960 [Vibrio sp. Hep-1b-8]
MFANSYFELGRFLPVSLKTTKHILPVFILTCLSNFLAPPLWRCFFMREIYRYKKSANRVTDLRFLITLNLPRLRAVNLHVMEALLL